MEKTLSVRCFDGAFGTYYFQLTADTEPCERANLTHPEMVLSIHKTYLEAGADAIKTNTFALHAPTFSDRQERADLRRAGYLLAGQAAEETGARVFCDIGPVPDEETTDPAEALMEAAADFADLGGRCFLFETQGAFAPLEPALAYLQAHVPGAEIAVSFAVSQDGFSNKGLSYLSLTEKAAAHPAVTMTGLNCVCGPVHMAELMLRLPKMEKPLLAMPNAGYPTQLGGRTFFQDNAAYFAEKVAAMAQKRPMTVGGCCGTTPEHIKRLILALETPGKAQNAAPKQHAIRAEKAQERSIFLEKQEKKLVAVELDPPLNADFTQLIEGAKTLKEAGVDLLTIADSPLARTRADSILSASIVQRETGMRVLPHLSCRDKNHIAIKGLLLGACYEGIHQILAVTGDPIMQDVFARKSAVFNFNSYELISFINTLNRDVFAHAPFAVGGALNVNAPKFDKELVRAKKKADCGAVFFMTQPIYTQRALENLAEAKRVLPGRILAGFMPVASYKNALFLNNEVSGVEIPQEMLDRLEGTDQQQAWDITVPFTAKMMEQAAPHCDGYYLMTPLKKVALMVRLIREAGL